MWSSSLFAQHTLKGKVLDEKTKNPLTFVNILSDKNYGAITDIDDNFVFNTMEKGFYESGLVINNILKLNTTTFGVGAFYHYGPYVFDKTSDNFAIKMSFGVAF